MPKLTRIDENLVSVTITEQEVVELRTIHNNVPTTGDVIQSLINMTMGFEPDNQYFISDITGAYDARKLSKSEGDPIDGWEYLYKTGSTNENLIFN